MSEQRYDIIHEDDCIVVVNKPSGMLVIPTPKKETNTLTDLLNKDLKRRGVVENIHPCHRLDRETSGLMVYAKGKHNQQLMMDLFKRREVKKVYVAFAHGVVKKNSDTLDSLIYNNNKQRNERAVSHYKVIERRKLFTVLEVQPVTGRTNQIRIQLKKIGHPLVGESVYAFRKDFDLKFKRVGLHASYIAFTHPVYKTTVSYKAPLPEDMRSFLGKHV